MRLRRRWFVSWLLLAAVTCAAPRGLSPAAPAAVPARAPAPAALRIDFVNVGQGDAALVTGPDGKRVLIDGGPRAAGHALAALLQARRISAIDFVLLTHRHEDHLGGIAEVVRAVRVRMFMDAPFHHPSRDYEKLLETLQDHHVIVHNATIGRTLDLGGGATITLLGPPDPPITHSRSDVNANSVVARLDYGQVGVLFTGDAEPQTEKWLLTSGAQLRAQILKVAHHGGRYSSTDPFLNAVAPEVAVISVGAVNEYGHPTPEAIGRLERRQARIYRTDRDGTVTVETDGTHIDVTTANGKRAILSAR